MFSHLVTSCAGDRHNMPRPLQTDRCPFDLESGVRVACDVGYLCANFSLPRPLCSRLRPDVRDSQTSDAYHRFMPLPGAGRNKRKFEEKNTRCVLYSKEEFRVTRLHTANTTSRVGHTTATTVILAPFELHRTSLLSVRAHLSLSLSLFK